MDGLIRLNTLDRRTRAGKLRLNREALILKALGGRKASPFQAMFIANLARDLVRLESFDGKDKLTGPELKLVTELTHAVSMGLRALGLDSLPPADADEQSDAA
jgi:hypothetical protein